MDKCDFCLKNRKGLLLLKDLGRPERFLRVMLRPLASWLSVGAWVLMFFGFFGMLHLALLLAPSLGSSPWVRIPAMIFALALITYDGLLLSASRGIAAWGSGLLAPLFAANALAAGCAVVLPGYSGSPLLWANFGFLLAELVILLCHLAALQGGSTGARAAGTVLLRGEQKFLFLGGTLFAGMVLPLLLLATQLSAPGPTDIVLGLNALLNVAGLCCMRISLLKSGVTTPAL